jgi:hypothetical protein
MNFQAVDGAGTTRQSITMRATFLPTEESGNGYTKHLKSEGGQQVDGKAFYRS